MLQSLDYTHNAKVLVNALAGQVKSSESHMSGNATNQDLGRCCDKFSRMQARKFRVGDKVKVIGIPTLSISRELEDELGTKELFKNMLGRVYTVQGFDRYGHIELHPKRMSHVWIEPEFLKLRKRRPTRA
jgi:hypothetical protein